MGSGSRRVLRGSLIKACKSCLSCLIISTTGNRLLTMGDRMISYPNYKFTFPIKALGMFGRKYSNPELQ